MYMYTNSIICIKMQVYPVQIKMETITLFNYSHGNVQKVSVNYSQIKINYAGILGSGLHRIYACMGTRLNYYSSSLHRPRVSMINSIPTSLDS